MSKSEINFLASHHPKKHIKSFYYAFRGLKHVILSQANFRFHIFAGILAVLLAFYFRFSTYEWLFLTFVIAFVLITEIINSLIEEVVDHLIQEHHEGARIIKDVGAASVLVAAIFSAIVGIFLFLPKILALFK